MWVLVLPQADGSGGISPEFWLGLSVSVLPMLVVLALITVLRREFRAEFPHVEDFNNLKVEVAELNATLDKGEHRMRDDWNKEFGRIREAMDRHESTHAQQMLELRSLVRDLGIAIQTARDEAVRVRHDFELYQKDVELRLRLLEEERLARRQA